MTEETGARAKLLRPILSWVAAALADPQRIILVALIGGLIAFLWLAGNVLAPIIASIVIAYLVDRPVEALVRLGLSRTICALLFTLLFVAVLAAALLLVAPLLLGQIASFARSLPAIFGDLQSLVLGLSAQYPDLIDEDQVRDVAARLNRDVVNIGQEMIVYSVTTLPTLATVVIYLFILPLLVFFFIKDQEQILAWADGFLPEHRPLAERVWREISFKIGGYVRGKLYEMLIVGGVCYATFAALGLDFAALLAALAGASVLIPYFGAPMAGVPVALVAFSQWGLGSDLYEVMIAYTIIQTIDGTILATILLAGAVNLHPIAVMVAIFVFGDLYGFWGVFFAVPLASAVQVVMAAWSQQTDRHATARAVQAEPRRDRPEDVAAGAADGLQGDDESGGQAPAPGRRAAEPLPASAAREPAAPPRTPAAPPRTFGGAAPEPS